MFLLLLALWRQEIVCYRDHCQPRVVDLGQWNPVLLDYEPKTEYQVWSAPAP